MSPDETRVHGCSDDLVELDGAIYDEVNVRYNEPAVMLRFNTGARLLVWYGEGGIWRIRDRTVKANAPRPVITRCEDREGFTGVDGPIYSDLAVIAGATRFKSRDAAHPEVRP